MKVSNSYITTNTMKRLSKSPSVSRKRAIEIACNHNCVSLEIAQSYTDSELKEVYKQLNIKANF